MRFVSTRGQAPAVALPQALGAGLATDGGLYMPEHLPILDLGYFGDLQTPQAVTARLLEPFFVGLPLQTALQDICNEALQQPLFLRAMDTPGDYLLELFHGPTLAFKDIGARFLAASLARLRLPAGALQTILVATSGDTGAAVAAAFYRRPGFRVVILYPKDRIAPRQAHQLGAFGENVLALCVEGSFDDCQRMVKSALQNAAPGGSLNSANSISLGRLLPQMGYYAWAALQHQREYQRLLSFVIPTGNLGNALACVLAPCVLARKMGLPIGKIVLATNANDVLPRFFAGAGYTPQISQPTLANAMDVGAPSNFERLRWLYGDDALLRRELSAYAVSDAAIRDVFKARVAHPNSPPCPHTATALQVLSQLRKQGDTRDYAVVATAHAAKFSEVIEPLLGHAIDTPWSLQRLLSRPTTSEPLPAQELALQVRLSKLAKV